MNYLDEGYDARDLIRALGGSAPISVDPPRYTQGETRATMAVSDPVAAFHHLVARAERDPAYRPALRDMIVNSGVLELLELAVISTAKKPLLIDIPADWTCYQVALFDNGNDERDKRGRRSTLKTKWRINLKAWSEQKPTFVKGSEDWAATVPFWSRDVAERQISGLMAKKSISGETGKAILDTLSNLPAGEEWYVGVPFRKVGGTSFADGHVVYLQIEAGQPVIAAFVVGEVSFVVRTFDKFDPARAPLQGGVIGQARITRGCEVSHWQTQSV